MLIASLLRSSSSSRLRSRSGGRALQVVSAVSAALLPALASAAPWELEPSWLLPDANLSVSQKLELLDFNADGFVDIAVANCSGDNTGNDSDEQLNQLFVNNMGMGFTEVNGVFADPDNAYVMKAGDLDNDGDLDLVVGVNFFGQSYVLFNTNGTLAPDANKMFPMLDISVGDLELGDVDGDHDLDILATDWGMKGIYGGVNDIGGPLRLWLNDGAGNFTEAPNGALPDGVTAAWSFDVEFVDIDNDRDLDAVIASRGLGDALVLQNDGMGVFTNLPMPSLQPGGITKAVNTAFTPMDFNGDGFVDLVTLQDGPGDSNMCPMFDGVTICAERNSIQINQNGVFADNPGPYWELVSNQQKLDFDAATIDFDQNGTPDVVTTGLRLSALDNNNRLLINNGSLLKLAAAPNDQATPIVAQLSKSFGVMFADFDQDKLDDIALVSRDGALPNYVLKGKGITQDACGLNEACAPTIAPYDKLADALFFGEPAFLRARVHDRKTPTHLHDYLWVGEQVLQSYNLIGDGAMLTAHGRRLPYIEFAFSLMDPAELGMMADTDPKKFIAPSIWYGEAMWWANFKVPYNNKKVDTLTWNYCAIDASGNKRCVGPFMASVNVPPDACGDGVVQEWEACDTKIDPLCVMCELFCGDGICTDPPENNMNCPDDCPCDNDMMCDPGENEMLCPNDCGFCGDGQCVAPETPENCEKDCGGPCDNDGICEPPDENNMNCPNDCPCDNDGMCEPGQGENEMNCPGDCIPDPTEGTCGDGVCDPNENPMNCKEDCPPTCGDGFCTMPEETPANCPQDCPGETSGDTSCEDSAGGGPGQCELDDDGCGCVAEPSDTRGLWASLLLFGVFGVRRFRKRA